MCCASRFVFVCKLSLSVLCVLGCFVCICVLGGPREARGEGAVCVLFFCVVGCGGHPQAIGLGRRGWVPRPDPQDSPAALGRAVTAELGRLQVDPMGPFVVDDVRDVLLGLGVPVQLQAPILRSLFVTFPILSVVCVSSLSRMLHTRILIGPSSPSAYPSSLAAPPTSIFIATTISMSNSLSVWPL